MNDYVSWKEVDDALVTVQYMGNVAHLEDALIFVEDNNFRNNVGHRAHVNNLLILITNDRSINDQEESAADDLKRADYYIVVAYLSSANSRDLERLASSSNYVRPASEFRSDEDLQERILVESGCGFGEEALPG